jgi:hypothetical protein
MPLLAAAAPAPKSALVTEVRALISRDDFTAADNRRVRDYFSEHGATSDWRRRSVGWAAERWSVIAWTRPRIMPAARAPSWKSF